MGSTVWRLPRNPASTTSPARLPTSADVVIIGAGLTGLSCAYHLLESDPDASVAVLDAAPLGSGASGKTMGMIAPGLGQGFAGLVRRIGLQRATAIYTETREAVRDVAEIIAFEDIDCCYEHVGRLMVAHGEQGEARLLRQAKALESAGQPCVRLNADELAARINLETAARKAKVAALFLPDAVTVDPLMLLHGFARAVQARGGEIHCDARVADVVDGRRVTVRLASGAIIKAGKVVLATAAESPKLANLTGRIIPVSIKVIATAPLTPEQLALVGWKGRESIVDSRKLFNYFRLTPDNRIVFGGGTPLYGLQDPPDYEDLEGELHQTFPHSHMLHVKHRWGGTIDYTLDGLPVVGPVRVDGNVLHAGGFCGHGIALGVRAGRWVADAIVAVPERRMHPDFRNTAPLVPGDWLRKTCFNLASGWMRMRGI
ncbi:MAG: FAD-dependent oxidoreductase [Usitatibacter sp.]